MSSVGSSSRVRPGAAAQLGRGRGPRAEVGHGGGHDERVGRRERREDGVTHQRRRGRLDQGRCFRERHGRHAADERHPGAACQRGLGDGDTHAPGRAIADEPDRVDGLGRATRRHDDVPAREVATARRLDDRRPESPVRCTNRPVPDGRDDRVDEPWQLGEPALTDGAGRERTHLRLHDPIAEAREGLHVGARGGMGVHVAIHRRRHDHGRCRGEACRGHHVVRRVRWPSLPANVRWPARPGRRPPLSAATM